MLAGLVGAWERWDSLSPALKPLWTQLKIFRWFPPKTEV